MYGVCLLPTLTSVLINSPPLAVAEAAQWRLTASSCSPASSPRWCSPPAGTLWCFTWWVQKPSVEELRRIAPLALDWWIKIDCKHLLILNLQREPASRKTPVQTLTSHHRQSSGFNRCHPWDAVETQTRKVPKQFFVVWFKCLSFGVFFFYSAVPSNPAFVWWKNIVLFQMPRCHMRGVFIICACSSLKTKTGGKQSVPDNEKELKCQTSMRKKKKKKEMENPPSDLWLQLSPLGLVHSSRARPSGRSGFPHLHQTLFYLVSGKPHAHVRLAGLSSHSREVF